MLPNLRVTIPVFKAKCCCVHYTLLQFQESISSPNETYWKAFKNWGQWIYCIFMSQSLIEIPTQKVIIPSLRWVGSVLLNTRGRHAASSADRCRLKGKEEELGSDRIVENSAVFVDKRRDGKIIYLKEIDMSWETRNKINLARFEMDWNRKTWTWSATDTNGIITGNHGNWLGAKVRKLMLMSIRFSYLFYKEEYRKVGFHPVKACEMRLDHWQMLHNPENIWNLWGSSIKLTNFIFFEFDPINASFCLMECIRRRECVEPILSERVSSIFWIHSCICKTSETIFISNLTKWISMSNKQCYSSNIEYIYCVTSFLL